MVREFSRRRECWDFRLGCRIDREEHLMHIIFRREKGESMVPGK
jgi:hypothetical protein